MLTASRTTTRTASPWKASCTACLRGYWKVSRPCCRSLPRVLYNGAALPCSPAQTLQWISSQLRNPFSDKPPALLRARASACVRVWQASPSMAVSTSRVVRLHRVTLPTFSRLLWQVVAYGVTPTSWAHHKATGRHGGIQCSSGSQGIVHVPLLAAVRIKQGSKQNMRCGHHSWLSLHGML